MGKDREVMILGLATESHIPGSVQITATCGHECMVSPSGKSHLSTRPDVETSCMACAGMTQEMIVYQAAMRPMPVVAGQREELIAALGEERARKVFKMLNMDMPDSP